MLFQHIRHVDYLDVWMHDGATEMIRDQADWVTPLCVKEHYGVEATFVHVDKDMAEIAMAKKICPKAEISLCWWHLRRAVHTCLANRKLSTTPCNVKRTHAEFPFIDPTFVPVGRLDASEYEGGMHDDLAATYEPANQVHVEKLTYQSTPPSSHVIASSSSSQNPPIGSKLTLQCHGSQFLQGPTSTSDTKTN